MSEATKAALDAALAEHIADELDGALVTGYVCQVTAMTGADFDAEQTQYLRMVPDHQSAHVTLGIIDYAQAAYRHALMHDD
jgi:hypothetical protein